MCEDEALERDIKEIEPDPKIQIESEKVHTGIRMLPGECLQPRIVRSLKAGLHT
jgi:hypothetical protein